MLGINVLEIGRSKDPIIGRPRRDRNGVVRPPDDHLPVDMNGVSDGHRAGMVNLIVTASPSFVVLAVRYQALVQNDNFIVVNADYLSSGIDVASTAEEKSNYGSYSNVQFHNVPSMLFVVDGVKNLLHHRWLSDGIPESNPAVIAHPPLREDIALIVADTKEVQHLGKVGRTRTTISNGQRNNLDLELTAVVVKDESNGVSLDVVPVRKLARVIIHADFLQDPRVFHNPADRVQYLVGC